MKDPTAPPSGDRKKIMFYDSLDRQTRFRIRCQHDNINQSQFFRLMITGYVDNHPDITNYLDEKKRELGLQGKHKRAAVSSLHRGSQESIKKFNLDDKEIETIFDIIETEASE